jgi:MFS transporter, PAT family, beta-lactamase induction signal transducer AmpG
VMGRRRPWVLMGQLGMVLSSLVLAVAPDPFGHVGLLMALGFAFNFFAAFQDVAVDGMAIEIVPVEEQARANGFMWGGKMLGIAGAAAGGAWMLNTYGLGWTMAVHAALVGGVMFVPLLLRERPGERLLPWTTGVASTEAAAMQLEGWRSIGACLVRALRMPATLALLAIAFTHGLVNGLFEATMPLLTVRELDWTDSAYSQLAGTARIVSGVLGMVLGGVLVDRIGRRAGLTVTLFAMGAGGLAMALLPALWPSVAAVRTYVIFYQVAYVFSSIAFFATAMTVCWKRIGATQFAMFMATSNLGLSTGSALLGPIGDPFGYGGLFLAAAGVAAIGLALVAVLNLPRHVEQLGRLDLADLPAPPLLAA